MESGGVHRYRCTCRTFVGPFLISFRYILGGRTDLGEATIVPFNMRDVTILRPCPLTFFFLWRVAHVTGSICDGVHECNVAVVPAECAPDYWMLVLQLQMRMR